MLFPWKALDSSRRWLHICRHGLFATNEVRSVKASERVFCAFPHVLRDEHTGVCITAASVGGQAFCCNYFLFYYDLMRSPFIYTGDVGQDSLFPVWRVCCIMVKRPGNV